MDETRRLTVEVWLTIDATLDNVASTASVDLDDRLASAARRLRERGWDVNAEHPETGRGPVGWPPLDAVFEIELSDAELAFTRTHLAQGVSITERILALPNLPETARREQEDSLTALRRALAAVDAL